MAEGEGTRSVHGGERSDPATGALEPRLTDEHLPLARRRPRGGAKVSVPGLHEERHPNFEAASAKFASPRRRGGRAVRSGMAALAGTSRGTCGPATASPRRRTLRRHAAPCSPTPAGGASRRPTCPPRALDAAALDAALAGARVFLPRAPRTRSFGSSTCGASPSGREPPGRCSSSTTPRDPREPAPARPRGRSRLGERDEGPGRSQRPPRGLVAGPKALLDPIRRAGRSTGPSPTPRPPGCSSAA